MRAIVYDAFRGPIELRDIAEPTAPPGGVVLEVSACGLCRSDWHGWQGHDADVRLPQVPGHEIAGVVSSVGAGVTRVRGGERVTVPFCLGCGGCAECARGRGHICLDYAQPGFTMPGAFAERVAIPHADENLVPLPETIDDVAAASLGCRFATAFGAVIDRARVARGEHVAVLGAGGVGLSAVMIAASAGARVIAVDVNDGALDLARAAGADELLDARIVSDVGAAIVEITGGGADVAIDALGSAATCRQGVECLARRGRFVQVGVFAPEEASPRLPMGLVMWKELTLLGSHGLPARRYGALLELVTTGRIDPGALVTRRIGLEEVPAAIEAMGSFEGAGVTVADRIAR